MNSSKIDEKYINSLKQIGLILKAVEINDSGFINLNSLASVHEEMASSWNHLYEHPISVLEMRINGLQNQISNQGQYIRIDDLTALSEEFIGSNPTSINEPLTEEQEQWISQRISSFLESEEGKANLLQLFETQVIYSTALIFNYVSQMVYGKSIHELLYKNTSTTSILSAVRVDKSCVNHPIVLERIKKAQLSGDKTFFDNLSSEIKKPNFHSRANYPLTYMAYYIFERDGILTSEGKLSPDYTYAQILDILHEADLFYPNKEGIMSDKKLHEHIQNYFNKKQSVR